VVDKPIWCSGCGSGELFRQPCQASLVECLLETNLESLNGLTHYILEEYLAQKLVPKSALKYMGNTSTHFPKKRAARLRKLTGLPFTLVSGFLSGHPAMNYCRRPNPKQCGEKSMARALRTRDGQTFAIIWMRRQVRLGSQNPERSCIPEGVINASATLVTLSFPTHRIHL